MPLSNPQKATPKKNADQDLIPIARKIQLAGQPVLQPRRKTLGPDHGQPVRPRILSNMDSAGSLKEICPETEIWPSVGYNRISPDPAEHGIRLNLTSGRIPQTHVGREWVSARTLKPTPAERGFSVGSGQKSGDRTSERGEREIARDGGDRDWVQLGKGIFVYFF